MAFRVFAVPWKGTAGSLYSGRVSRDRTNVLLVQPTGQDVRVGSTPVDRPGFSVCHLVHTGWARGRERSGLVKSRERGQHDNRSKGGRHSTIDTPAPCSPVSRPTLESQEGNRAARGWGRTGFSNDEEPRKQHPHPGIAWSSGPRARGVSPAGHHSWYPPSEPLVLTGWRLRVEASPGWIYF